MPEDRNSDTIARRNLVLTKALSSMGDRLEISIKMLATIWSLTSVPLKATNLDEAAEEILEIMVRELGEIHCCSILLFDEEEYSLKLKSAKGRVDLLGEADVSYNKALTFKPGEGVAGQVFQKNEPLFLNHDSPEAVFLKRDAVMTVPESMACMPLSTAEKRVGVLNISFLVEKNFDNIRTRHLMILSGVIANILQTILLKEQLKEKTESLTKSEEKYRNILESIEDGYYEVDPDGNFVFFNDSMCKILGYSPEELHAFNIRAVADEQSAKEIHRVFRTVQRAGSSTRSHELELIRKDGEKCYSEISVSPIISSENENVGFRGIARNITDRKMAELEKRQLEARLFQAEKMEAIGTLAGGVAHDLNNVLSGLVSYPEMILLDLPEESPLRKPIRMIQKSGEKAAAIVNDLLTLARRGLVSREVSSLNRVISDYLESREHQHLLKTHPNVRIETVLREDLANVSCSPMQLFKVVMNLITNSAEAMPNGGAIRIETANVDLQEPEGDSEQPKGGQYAAMRISDDGIGIAPDDLERIFEPFYSKKAPGISGTGLGMAIVWGTVKDHKGHIDVVSKVGEGTTFNISFPATREKMMEVAEAASLKSKSPLRGRGESILIVDDIEDQRELLSNMMERLGYTVTALPDGEAAVHYLKEHTADLVILDMLMPPGIDGLDTYRKIKKNNPLQKAVIVSGYSETERVKEALRLGAGGYIKKPYTVNQLASAIRSELDRVAEPHRSD